MGGKVLAKVTYLVVDGVDNELLQLHQTFVDAFAPFALDERFGDLSQFLGGHSVGGGVSIDGGHDVGTVV